MTNLGWLLDGALKLWKKSFILPHRKLEITLPLAVTTFWTRRASKTDWSLLRKKLWIWTTEDRLNYFLIVVKMKYLHNTKPKQKHKKKWQVSTSAFTSYRDSFSLSSVRIRWLFLDGHQGRFLRGWMLSTKTSGALRRHRRNWFLDNWKPSTPQGRWHFTLPAASPTRHLSFEGGPSSCQNRRWFPIRGGDFDERTRDVY